MRRAIALATVAACAGHPAAPPARPRTTAKPPAAPAGPFDDAWFVDAGGGREHLVIEQTESGWRFTTDWALESKGAGGVTRHIVVEISGDGFLSSIDETDAVTGAKPASAHATAQRQGSQLVVTNVKGTSRIDNAELYDSGLVGELAVLCFDTTPRRISAFGTEDARIESGIQIDDVTRATLQMTGGIRDLYCRDGRVLGLESSAGPVYREDEQHRFFEVRRPARPLPERPAGIVEIDRTVDVAAATDVEAATLSCTLVAPGDASRHPAVALVATHVDDARDGDGDGTGRLARRYPYRALAYALAAKGIASLRCDGRGGSAEQAREGLTADASAMLQALADDPTIDGKRLGYVGRLAGAAVAPVVASARKLRAIALLNPMDQALGDILVSQVQLAGGDVDAAKRAVAALAAGDPLPPDAPKEVASAMTSPTYTRSYLSFDPADAAKKVAGTAVLVAEPEFARSDGYVSDYGRIADAYRAASGKKQNTVVELEYGDVDADLREREAEDSGNRATWWAPLSSEVIEDVAQFFSEHL